ncbi:MAG: endoribonuclease [Acidobacteria bacterium]|jgi:2-iminobutanoate/2-iminopropanoate deaminase|nr:endoribonuclease [Acidobacteriota bacterium]
MYEQIETEHAPLPIGPYSQAIRANGFIFVSGQIPMDPETGTMVTGRAGEQTRQVMKNIAAILESAGSGLQKLVKTTIFLTSLEDFSEVNRVYAECLGDVKPARATVEVSRLPRDARVEIEAIALA